MFTTYPNQLVLVRHGQSQRNAAGLDCRSVFKTPEDRAVLASIPDHLVDLTDIGREEARCTGKALYKRGMSFDQVYHSGYLRTKATLENVLEPFPENFRTGVRVAEDVDLRERETGYSYFLTSDEMSQYFPWQDHYWKTVGPVFARPVGGESVMDLIFRVRLALERIFAKEAGKKVLLVTHGRVLTAIRFILEEWSYERLEQFLLAHGPRNCGVTIYDFSPEQNKLSLSEYDTVYMKRPVKGLEKVL